MHLEPPRQEKAKEFKFRLLKLELSPLEQELIGVASCKSDFHLLLLAHVNPDCGLLNRVSIFI